jgi:Patatin-like phospholipase
LTLPTEIRSLKSCFGCLQGLPSIILACGHSFCLDCIRDLAGAHTPLHRLTTTHCPFHRSLQAFSPRLLPVESGYRILSLDGGGVKGLAQLIVLGRIERKCFDIPITQLFDLIVGTSIGGQIALALAASAEPAFHTAQSATEKFKEMMESGFKKKVLSRLKLSPTWFGRAIYKESVVEKQLQRLFGMDTKLYGLATSSHPSLPHVGVTTVKEDPFEPLLVAN